jgi:hypothetical protein
MLKLYIDVSTLVIFYKTRLIVDLNTTSSASLEHSFVASKLSIKSKCIVRQNKLKNPLKTFIRRLRTG